ncbi:MAG TPA: hypothetical protein VGI05_12375 [Streptosporangiaceae bacterium]|jgi:hypothetical protein
MLTLRLVTPGDLAILMAGTGTTSVTGQARSVRHGYCDEAKAGG